MTAKKTTAASASTPASRIMLAANTDIAAADKLCTRLRKCAAKQQDVNLYASRVETIDTISLQLLLCFIRQVRDNGHNVHWKSPSEALLTTARLVGLETELSLISAST